VTLRGRDEQVVREFPADLEAKIFLRPAARLNQGVRTRITRPRLIGHGVPANRTTPVRHFLIHPMTT
jgi:hypothetical protein